MNNAELEVILRAKDLASADVKKFTQTTGTDIKKLEQTSVQSFNSMKGAIAGVAMAIAAVGVKRMIEDFVEAADSIEVATVRLKHMTGSLEGAQQALGFLRTEAAKVPYTFEEMMQSGQIVESFGAQMKVWIPTLSDLAAYMGMKLPEAASALGRAYSAGVGAADIFRERGVLALITEFAKMKYGIDDLTTLTLPEFRKMMYESFTADASKIKGAAKDLSDTWTGTFSNLKDAQFDLKVALGDTLLPALKDLSKDYLKPIIEDMTVWVRENDELIKSNVIGFVKGLTGAMTALKDVMEWYGKNSILGWEKTNKEKQSELSVKIIEINKQIKELEDSIKTFPESEALNAFFKGTGIGNVTTMRDKVDELKKQKIELQEQFQIIASTIKLYDEIDKTQKGKAKATTGTVPDFGKESDKDSAVRARKEQERVSKEMKLWFDQNHTRTEYLNKGLEAQYNLEEGYFDQIAGLLAKSEEQRQKIYDDRIKEAVTKGQEFQDALKMQYVLEPETVEQGKAALIKSDEDLAKAAKQSYENRWQAYQQMQGEIQKFGGDTAKIEREIMLKQVEDYRKAGVDKVVLAEWEAMRRAQIRENELLRTGDFMAGLKVAYERNLRDQATWAKEGLEIYKGMTQSLQTTLSDFLYDSWTGQLKSMKDYFQSFSNSIVRSFSDAVSKMIAQWLLFKAIQAGMSIASAYFGAYSTGPGGNAGLDTSGPGGGTAHQGGPIRLHSGGEVPILAQAGEYMIRKSSVNGSTLPALESINNSGKVDDGGKGAPVTVNIMAMDSESFTAFAYKNRGVFSSLFANDMANNGQTRRAMRGGY